MVVVVGVGVGVCVASGELFISGGSCCCATGNTGITILLLDLKNSNSLYLCPALVFKILLGNVGDRLNICFITGNTSTLLALNVFCKSITLSPLVLLVVLLVLVLVLVFVLLVLCLFGVKYDNVFSIFL